MICTWPLLPVQSPCIQVIVNIATINIGLGFVVYVRYPTKKLPNTLFQILHLFFVYQGVNYLSVKSLIRPKECVLRLQKS